MISKIVFLIPILCAIYVIYNVWFEDENKSLLNKILWTIFAVTFNIITAIVYALIKNDKYKA
jgi:predicted outer membrane lipoprotein